MNKKSNPMKAKIYTTLILTLILGSASAVPPTKSGYYHQLWKNNKAKQVELAKEWQSPADQKRATTMALNARKAAPKPKSYHKRMKSGG
jgi:NADH:ubiquinone oxidoreductase subunit